MKSIEDILGCAQIHLGLSYDILDSFKEFFYYRTPCLLGNAPGC